VSDVTAFDPNAPEGEEKRGSAYVSRKDIKIVAVGLIALGICFYPIFIYLQKRSERSRCIQDLKAISQAINQYAEQNDQKYPPIFYPGPGDGPMTQTSGAPFTWASNLVDFMNPRASFNCPSAQPSEITRSQDPRSENKSFELSYGMFAPLSTFNKSLVDDPNEAVLLAETSNRGALKTYDPMPFKDESGDVLPYDGMAIGWSDNNYDGSPKSKYVTRLAFPGTADKSFTKDGAGRHDEGSFIVTVTGQLRSVHPDFAWVQRRNKEIYGSWPMPLGAQHYK
jgi:hypothetical protein